MPRRLFLATIVAAGALPPLAALSGGMLVVEQYHRQFQPRTLEIRRGDVVRFTNSDPFPHEMYVDSPTFKVETGIQDPGTTQDVSFPIAGTFTAHCSIHPLMSLKIDVE